MMWKQASDTEQDFIECNVERDQVKLHYQQLVHTHKADDDDDENYNQEIDVEYF